MQQSGASAVILSDIDSQNFVYEGLGKALNMPKTEVRLFGKPKALIARRMGVAISLADNSDNAKTNAIKAAKLIKIINQSKGNI